jgi:hypothetical protein
MDCYNVSPGFSRALLLRSIMLSKPNYVAPMTATIPRLVPGRRSVLDLHHYHTKPRTSMVPFLKKRGLSCVAAVDDTASLSSSDSTKLDHDDSQNPAGKRQRRQAAATLVQSFPSWTGVGKKSKAQPRPAVHIPPRGIGPVAEPNQNDVLVSA